jgi:hypothetical protein
VNLNIDTLQKLEEAVKGKRFKCQRICGIDCCTKLGVVVSPFSSISFIAGYFRWQKAFLSYTADL